MFQTGLFRSKTTFFTFSKFPETLENTAFLRFLIMELRGVEPLSENPFIVLLQA